VDAWAQFDENGELLCLRTSLPQTEDGPKEVVWQKDKAEVWLKAKKLAVVVREPNMLAMISKAFFDPKLAMAELYEAEAQGKVQIETEEPSTEGEPIRVTATWAESEVSAASKKSSPRLLDSPAAKEVYLVDPETKLLQQLESYKLEGSDYEFIGRRKFLDYNEPIDPAIFKLNVPAEVVRIDQTTQEVGLAKGDLGDEEIAVEVVRQFFEALIAEDYAKAGQLFEGMPAEKMAQGFGKIKFLRIVSIGRPAPHPRPETRFLCVPCEVEIQADGTKSVRKFVANVRAVYNQPDRWTIGGGI